jgi:hypothetical protein
MKNTDELINAVDADEYFKKADVEARQAFYQAICEDIWTLKAEV